MFNSLQLVDLSAGDVELNGLSGELVVNRLQRIKLVVSGANIFGSKQHLVDLVSTHLESDALSNNLGGVDKVLQHSVVDSSQSTGLGSLLLKHGVLAGLGDDLSVGKENNMAVAELLLELTGDSLLDLVQVGDQRNGHKDNEGLLSSSNLQLSNVGNLQWSEVSLQIRRGVLKVDKGLADLELKLAGLLLGDFSGSRHVDSKGSFPRA